MQLLLHASITDKAGLPAAQDHGRNLLAVRAPGHTRPVLDSIVAHPTGRYLDSVATESLVPSGRSASSCAASL
eukprot:1841682-Pleurochrysis_carterae.AAC.1